MPVKNYCKNSTCLIQSLIVLIIIDFEMVHGSLIEKILRTDALLNVTIMVGTDMPGI